MTKTKQRKRCQHDAAIHTWRENHIGPTSSQCSTVFGCGERLSIGPSSDDGEDVRVEMRAAELDAWYNEDDLPVQLADGWTVFEIDGWRAHCSRGDLIGSQPFARLIRPAFDAGWLACEMTTHEHHVERDASAWPWDPSRPIAGQYEEHCAALAAAGRTGGNGLPLHLDAIVAQNPACETDDAPADSLAACPGCEVPFGCRDGHCLRGEEGERKPFEVTGSHE